MKEHAKRDLGLNTDLCRKIILSSKSFIFHTQEKIRTPVCRSSSSTEVLGKRLKKARERVKKGREFQLRPEKSLAPPLYETHSESIGQLKATAKEIFS